MNPRFPRLWTTTLWWVTTALAGPAFAATVDFSRDVAPIFDKSCVQCHGPKRSENGLRLDSRASVLKGGEHGPAAVAGNASASLIVQVVTGAHRELAAMPKKGDRLSPTQVAVLQDWINQGMVWPDTAKADSAAKAAQHWAFHPPVRPATPAVKNPRWVRSPLDAFVMARMEQEGLSPSPEADRITLLRRVHFDLTGLAPTPAEVDAFLADKAPGAYERVVESLLKSPHYGEKWGRQWLDAARYADSDGFEKDKGRAVWAYRDWVVNALNRDLPYDQFIVEQIAGDQLPNATEDQRVATGFLRNAMLNEEGGVDPEQFRMDGLFDRMDCIGKSILGLTIQCAQCHTHKYDPITQEEYYRMFAFLNNDHESSMVTYTPSEQMKRSDLLRQIRDLEEGLRHTTSDWQQRMAAWEAVARKQDTAWTYVDVRNAGDNGERYYHYEDHSIRAASYAPTQWTAEFRGTNDLASIGAFRMEQLPDPNLPSGGPGRSIHGMAALSEFKVEATDVSNPTNKLTVKFVKATADFSNEERKLEPEFQSEYRKRDGGDKRVYGPVAFAIDGKEDTAWGIDAGPGRRNVPRQAVFIPEKPIQFPKGAVLLFRLQQNHGGDNSDDNQNHNLGRFRLSVSTNSAAVADVIPPSVRQIFEIPPDRRTPAQVAAVFSYWRTTVEAFKDTNTKIEALWKQWPVGTPTLTLVARQGEGANEAKRPTHIFKRGDWLKPADTVKAGVPAALHPLPPGADDSRLTFARWMVDRSSPTTARVAVNRVWQSYFGTGLVETPEDLGVQSPPASHRELLDWLSVEFMDQGWSLKTLHRAIVTSATYRQSSRVTPDRIEKDRYNRLLSRGPRFRLDAELVRDVGLAASGLLNPAVGGPTAHPPAPSFLFLPPNSYGPKPWDEESGTNRYRRALYTFRYRSVPYPFLTTFDAPNGDFSCVRRTRSNTPLQALMALNETVSMECAQGLAALVLKEGGTTDDQRITYAFRRVLSRPPTPAERAEIKGLLARQQKRIAEGWVNPFELATGRNELPKVPAGTTPAQLAAYAAVSRVLLNLDEAITKE